MGTEWVLEFDPKPKPENAGQHLAVSRRDRFLHCASCAA